jgi:hypothetical protein
MRDDGHAPPEEVASTRAAQRPYIRNPADQGGKESRPMRNVRVAVMVLTALVLGTAEMVRALQCDGRLASIGDSSWEVQTICGAPVQVDDSLEVVLKPVYDPHGHVAGHLPVAVPKSVWTYNFGPTRLIYVLTFREGKLATIETGGYGH